MVSPKELKHICTVRQLAPVFGRPPGKQHKLVALNSTLPPLVDIDTDEQQKVPWDVPNYPDPLRPWLPYVPGITTGGHEQYKWLLLRLFLYEPHHLVTETRPYRLTEKAASAVIPSFMALSAIAQEIQAVYPLSHFRSSIPQLPAKHILEPSDNRNELMAACQRLGAVLLEVIALAIYASSHFPGPSFTTSRNIQDLLGWSKSPGIPLRGVVIKPETAAIQDISRYLDDGVPVHYVCHEGDSQFDPCVLGAKDMDARHVETHPTSRSFRKEGKFLAREERQPIRTSAPPVQKAKQTYVLQNNSGRRKLISKQKYRKISDLYRSELQKNPTGDVAVLYMGDSDEDSAFDSDGSPPGSMVVSNQPGRSDEPQAGTSTLPKADSDVSPKRRDNLEPSLAAPVRRQPSPSYLPPPHARARACSPHPRRSHSPPPRRDGRLLPRRCSPDRYRCRFPSPPRNSPSFPDRRSRSPCPPVRVYFLPGTWLTNDHSQGSRLPLSEPCNSTPPPQTELCPSISSDQASLITLSILYHPNIPCSAQDVAMTNAETGPEKIDLPSGAPANLPEAIHEVSPGQHEEVPVCVFMFVLSRF